MNNKDLPTMQSFEMIDLVHDIGLLIDAWHFTKCPHDESGPLYKDCINCQHFKLCSCLLQLSTIKREMYNSNGELRK